MKRDNFIRDKKEKDFYNQIISLNELLDNAFLSQYNRSLPFNENILDRWKRAKKLGFGNNTNIYNSSFVFGNVKVGSDCWIGPNTILDGIGELEIGNYTTISSGVQIYSHDNIKKTLSSNKMPVEKEKVIIGSNVYIAPNSIIAKGVVIGDYCVIGANSYVNKNIKNNKIVAGQPAVIIGEVILDNTDVRLHFFKS